MESMVAFLDDPKSTQPKPELINDQATPDANVDLIHDNSLSCDKKQHQSML
jgi:hypothetical protein